MNEPGKELSADAEFGGGEPLGADTASEETAARIGLADLVNLFTRPRLFFSGRLDLGGLRYVAPIVLLLGLGSQFDRIDQEILRHDLGQVRPTWPLIERFVTESWTGFWAFSLGTAVISGVMVYFIGGWWYWLRVRWSGAKTARMRAARHVYAWSNLVLALPTALITIVYTLTYPNYLTAYHSDETLSLLLPPMIFWSVGVSYVGARRTFELTPWKARVWLLALPAAFYLFAMGAILGLMTFLT